MEIDWEKVYYTWNCSAAGAGPGLEMLKAYHRQLEELVGGHVHEHGFSAHGLTGYPTWQTPPHPTCPLCKKPLP